PASPQEAARRAWLPGAAPRSDSIFDRPLPPSPQPPPVATAEHRSLLDAAPEDALDVAAEEVGGAPQAEKFDREGDATAPALGRGRRFFDRLKFGRSEPRLSEPQAQEERMFEPQARQERMFEPREPHPHEGFSEPMLESSYPLDDAYPPDQGRHAATDAIDDEYAYEEADEDVAPRRRRYGHL